jgi:prepilin-type N-terminal cleavage/methylation domain-containing protein
MNRRTHNSGFTLIELLLVMLLIAVAASIMAPSFSGFSRGRRLPNTATSLVTTAWWCRVQALTDGVTYRLVIDRSNRQWYVMKDDGTGQFVASDQDQGKEHVLPEGIEFGAITFEKNYADENQQGDFITFKMSGRTDVATIRLESDKGQYVEVANDMPLGTFHIVTTVIE